MNREIKFRSWIGKKIVYWGFMPDGNFQGPPISLGAGENANNTPQMQFTGIKDIEGKEIYEGDLISFEEIRAANQVDIPAHPTPELLEQIIHMPMKRRKCLGEVCYMYCTWRIEVYLPYKGSTNLGGITVRQLKVVGNIYENPELLAP